MEALLTRYRHLTVLVLVVAVQLVLLAYQVKGQGEVRLIRLWAVASVMPLAKLIDAVRGGFAYFTESYILLVGVKEENRRLKAQVDTLKLENQYLRTELGTAERARALVAFQERSPSRTKAARIIATGSGVNSKVVFVDAGSESGVAKGMGVITPDGIVGKVLAAYPGVSQVMLVTDPNFAAGVISVKHRVKGTLRGRGQPLCLVDYVESEQKVEVGEWFYTSGDDRIFPKGLPAGQVRAVGPGSGTLKEIYLAPAAMAGAIEEVLIVLSGVHQELPDATKAPPQSLHLLPPPPPEAPEDPELAGSEGGLQTDADRLYEKYRRRSQPLAPAPSGEGREGGGSPSGSPAPGGQSQPPAAAQP
jgi:rod shape-determining protein MreC